MQQTRVYDADEMGSSGEGQAIEPLAPRQVLDYTKAKIIMEVGNIIEKSFRINACDKEPWTVEFIESIPKGGWFIDIGASTGPYTLIAIANNLNVVAIEPAFESYRRLCRNLAHNQALDKALVLCVALGAGLGYDWYHYHDIRPGAGSNIMGGDTKQTWHRQLVQIMSLDFLISTLAAEAPIFIKLDVDGGEDAVLLGAVETLANPRLEGLIIEVPLKKEAEIATTLTAAGLVQTARYDQRNGATIGEVCYLRFARNG